MVLVETEEAAKMLEVVDAKLVDIASIREAEGANSGQEQESRELCGRIETRNGNGNVDFMVFLLETGSQAPCGTPSL